jgi:hypothetical protein
MIPFLKLLDEVVNPPLTTKEKQEKFVEGSKDFTAGIKEAVDKFNPFKDLSKFNPFRRK